MSLGVLVTAVFVHGDDEQVIPDWPAAAGEHFSVMLEYVGDLVGNEVDAKVDFVGDELRPSARFLVMEGGRPVAEAQVTEVFIGRATPAGG